MSFEPRFRNAAVLTLRHVPSASLSTSSTTAASPAAESPTSAGLAAVVCAALRRASAAGLSLGLLLTFLTALQTSAAVPASASSDEPLRCGRTAENASYDWAEHITPWRVVDSSSPDQRAWTGHRVGYDIAVHGRGVYIAYYGLDRRLTVAYRPHPDHDWQVHRVGGRDALVNWDSHNGISIGVDPEGHLHVAANMHADELRYWRTERPGRVRSLEKVETMVSERRESRITYPTFINDENGNLLFHYRQGGSGEGDTYINRYDHGGRSWSAAFGGPLFNGSGHEGSGTYSPYLRLSDEPNEQGYYELIWMWRSSTDVSTNSRLSYMRSQDLRNWETAHGQPVELPVNYDTPGVVVDDVPERGGLWNGSYALTHYEGGMPLIAYTKYAADGTTQIFTARPYGDAGELGQWQNRRVTDWTGRAQISGTRSLDNPIQLGTFRPLDNGDIQLNFRCTESRNRAAALVLNPGTLQPIAETAQPYSGLPHEVRQLNTAAPSANEGGSRITGGDDVRYLLRWQNQGSNRDRAFSRTSPPLPIRVYELRQDLQSEPPQNLRAEHFAGGNALFWDAPATTGGWDLENYLVEYSTDGEQWHELTVTEETAALHTFPADVDPESMTYQISANTGRGRGSAATVQAEGVQGWLDTGAAVSTSRIPEQKIRYPGPEWQLRGAEPRRPWLPEDAPWMYGWRS